MEEIEEKITLALDKETWEEFKKYCALNAFKISKKIELLLKEEIERGPKTKSLIEIFKEIIEKQKQEVLKPVEKESKEERVVSETVEKVVPAMQVVKEDNPKMIGSGKKVPKIEELMRKKF